MTIVAIKNIRCVTRTKKINKNYVINRIISLLIINFKTRYVWRPSINKHITKIVFIVKVKIYLVIYLLILGRQTNRVLELMMPSNTRLSLMPCKFITV